MRRPLVAILRGLSPVEAPAVARALVAAGIDTIEVPLNRPGALEALAEMVRVVGTKATLGAGTVLSPDEVRAVKAAGGQLVVSPDMNPEVIAASRAAGLMSCPGVATPTEALAALRAGADMLKLFPAFQIGPAGLAAWRAVLPPGAKVLAVGGIGPGDFAPWLAAGAAGFGLGSHLYKPGNSAEQVAEKAAKIVSALDAALAALPAAPGSPSAPR
ncbi:MAG: 2-dehydro-3-deoxy-6-phosphogalactonate aldolase [Alphaproteobacteria bacterium]|nr:MAG: 2-dehydro-3-deoxy-6-phosphogalactonate aldolase [Alphaproteobacteria bacterium]